MKFTRRKNPPATFMDFGELLECSRPAVAVLFLMKELYIDFKESIASLYVLANKFRTFLGAVAAYAKVWFRELFIRKTE